MNYPWYSVLEDNKNIEQGDFVPDCPIITPPKNLNVEKTVEVNVEYVDSIIITQSCDIANESVEIILLCPHYPLKDFFELIPDDQKTTQKAKHRIIDNLTRINRKSQKTNTK